MDLRHRFAENLTRARRAANLSQRELADQCDLHRTEISLLERAGREPRLGTVIKLAAALGVPPESLCTGMSWDEKYQCFKFDK